jgi:hypothetical protein
MAQLVYILRIPEVFGHPFRLISDTHSGGFRTLREGRHLTFA